MSSSQKRGSHPPCSSSCCQNSHSSCRTHHTVQLPTGTATGKSLIILIFTIKALIIIPALFACSECLITYRMMRKKPGTQLIFPQPCLPGSCSCLCSTMPHHRAGQPGLKLAEPWRATSNLRTRLASRAEQSMAQSDINEKPSRAFQQAH